MSGAAAGAAAATIAIVEAYFKDYLICCEYLKLDPTYDYSEGVIRVRAGELLKSLENADEKIKRKTEKKLSWFLRNYKKLTGRWYGFTKRCIKLIKKEKLCLHEGTVLDDFFAGELTQKNYDFFANLEKKYVVIALIIVGGIFVLAATAVLAVLLL